MGRQFRSRDAFLLVLVLVLVLDVFIPLQKRRIEDEDEDEKQDGENIPVKTSPTDGSWLLSPLIDPGANQSDLVLSQGRNFVLIIGRRHVFILIANMCDVMY